METIDIKELLDYFKSKLAIIFFITIVAGMIGCLYGIFIQVPVYKSSTSIVLISSSNQEGALTNNDVYLNQNLVSTYSEIIKSKRVLKEVINNLDLDINYNALVNNVEVSSVSNTELIRITVTSENKKDAKNIANETAKVFAKEIPELYNISNVNILDKAEIATNPSNINVPKQLALSIGVGLVLGCGLVFMIFYFDRSVKSREQVESKLGLSVLGTVQEYKR